MIKMPYDYRIAAVFIDKNLSFRGNTAAIIQTPILLSHPEMQQVAYELNQPATTFLSPTADPNTYQVRWYAPEVEIGLCGHGAAAAAAFLGQRSPDIESFTLLYAAGQMQVKYKAPYSISLILDPIPVKKEILIPPAISKGLGIPLLAMFETSNKHIILAASEKAIRHMTPNFEVLRQSEIFGYAVTAPGDTVDFVSRTFVPHVQQLEDHATGSSHAMLAPFWSARLNKKKMTAHQLSPRGGAFHIQLDGDKLTLSGDFEWSLGVDVFK